MVQNVSMAKRDPVTETRAEPRDQTAFPFHEPSRPTPVADAKDYFVNEDGRVYAGRHVLVDFWNADHLDDIAIIEGALREAANACAATLLHVHLHKFSKNGGVSGVAVLAESHISVHTWPERAYAAFDVFMCGTCDARLAVPVLERVFKPGKVQIHEQKRGLVE